MRIRLHLKIFIFIAISIITRQIEIYGLLMLFAVFHELGHMITGMILGFKPCMLDIMPFGLSIGFEGKVDNYNKKVGKASLLTLKKAIIAIAGPVTNLIFVLVFSLVDSNFFEIKRETMIYANILIGTFNLIPIYPLDGGRIIKYMLHIICGKKNANYYINKVSYATIVALTAFCSIAILYLKNMAILIILAYLWYLVIRENRKYENKKKIYERLNNFQKENATNIFF